MALRRSTDRDRGGSRQAVFDLVGISLLDSRPFLLQHGTCDALLGQAGQCLSYQEPKFLLKVFTSHPEIPVR